LIWEKNSPIWAAIAAHGKLPLFQDCEAPTTPTTSLAQRINDMAGITPHNPTVNGGEFSKLQNFIIVLRLKVTLAEA
jgi:hypothetical protein